jgi:hypothetical protein
MLFLNPLFLIGTVVLSIPVLVHLVRREKSEVIRFSSLMFLLKVPKRAVRQQKLKNLLLMLLRLLILALLVAAFMRPYFSDNASPLVAAGSSQGIVMLLDNSYSMRYGTNFDRLKTEANKRISAMGVNDRMSLVVFNDNATVLARPTSDKSQLEAAVSTLEPSFGGTRYYEAFSAADRALQQFGNQHKQLVVISDFQRSGWNRSSRESVIGKDVETKMINLAVDNSKNVGIDNVSVDATSFTRTFGGHVRARIHNYRKDQSVTVPVSLSINGKEVGSRQTKTIPPNSTELAEFTGFDLQGGASKGKVKIEADDPLLVDNEFLFSIERREKLKVLLLDDGRRDTLGRRQSFYLQGVFAASTELPMEVSLANANDLHADDLPMYDIVVINDVTRLSDAIRNRLIDLHKTGQGQMVILGEYADLNWWNNYAGMPVKLGEKILASRSLGRPSVSMTTFDRNHGIFKKFQNSAKFTLSTAQFFSYTQMDLKPGATALVKFEDGSPAMAESSGADRGLVVFASSVDNAASVGWNDFPLKASFVPMFIEVARYLSHSAENREWYALGEGIPVVGALVGGAAAVITPSGERQSLGELAAGEQKFFTPTVPGFHEIRVGRESRVIAVNPPSNEGNLDVIPPDELLASVQSTAAEAQKGRLFETDDQLEHAKRQLSWWYILVVAIFAAIAEIYIANKSYRPSSGTLIPGKNTGSGQFGIGRNG